MEVGMEEYHSKGGRVRSQKLNKQQRSDIARKAAVARWSTALPDATHEGELEIGDLKLPVAVTSDGTRLLISRAFMSALGRPWKGSYDKNPLPNFIDAKNLAPFLTTELLEIVKPIEFVNKRGQRAQGYRAELLQMVCDVYLEARKAGALTKSQDRIADQAEILIRGFARIGIIALVDEATGYQRDRAKDALTRILEAFIAKELQPWVKTFPDEFYEELFRLRGLEFPRDTVKRPQYFGHLTNDIVYKRLAPEVLEELRNTVPKTPSGRRKATFHQKLTPDLGHPLLREHLAKVITVMKLSDGYQEFKSKLDRIAPPYGESGQFDFEEYDRINGL